MACLRRVQGWNLDLAIAEYLRYADPKPRPLDRTYIASYNPATLADAATKVGAASWKTNILNIEVLNRVTVDGDGNRLPTGQDVVRHTYNTTSNFK
jgi:tyrosine-protein phosphatase SIW14